MGLGRPEAPPLEQFLAIGLDKRTAQNALVNQKVTANLLAVIKEVLHLPILALIRCFPMSKPFPIYVTYAFPLALMALVYSYNFRFVVFSHYNRFDLFISHYLHFQLNYSTSSYQNYWSHKHTNILVKSLCVGNFVWLYLLDLKLDIHI